MQFKSIRLLNACDVYQPKTIATKYFVPDGKYTVYGANGEIGQYDEYNHEEPEVLMACRGATCGTINVSKPFSWINGNAMVIHPNGTVPLRKDYLKYYLMSVSKDSIISGTAQPQITRQNLKDFQIVICDLDDQQKIVSQIEESLSQLDNAVETLNKTKQQLEIYRQAVLKEAFQGGYTTTWRDENTEKSALKDYQSIDIRTAPFKDVSGDENEIRLNLPTEWVYLRIGEVFEVEVGSTPSRQNDKYWNGSINWVSSGEVRFNHIKSTKESISEDGFNNSSTSIQPIGTVMLAMIGEGKTRGQAAILDIQAAHNQNTAAILVSKTPCDPRYVYYFLQLNYNHTRRVGSGNNQKALNKERVRALHFPFAPFEEQRIIVNEIECRLSLCDDITKTVNHSLRQAEALRQSILKQAFEEDL